MRPHRRSANPARLANTLSQTANFKPGIVSKKMDNFYYTGQLTVPGPGIPPTIISGQVAAAALLKGFEARAGKQSDRKLVN